LDYFLDAQLADNDLRRHFLAVDLWLDHAVFVFPLQKVGSSQGEYRQKVKSHDDRRHNQQMQLVVKVQLW